MSPSSTPDAQLLPIARHLVEERTGGLLGLAVFGSAATSGLRPDSDIDLIMVTASSLTTRERRELVELLLITSGWRGHAATFPDAADRRPIELTSLVSAPDTPWRACPRRDFQFGEWLRADLLRGNLPTPAEDPDLVILAATALHGHQVLFGPPLDALIAPIPREVLGEAMIAAIPELLAGLPGDERNTLLTLARILVTLETGRIVPKDTAAAQIAGSLSEPGRRLLTRAGDEYLEGRDGRWTGDGGDVADLATELARRAMQLDTRRAVGRLHPTTPADPACTTGNMLPWAR